MSKFYNREGQPLKMMEWAQIYGDPDYRLIAVDTVGEAHISTVWLGVNHNHGAGPPLIFETMIFDGTHDGEQWRYSTEDDALEGHDRIVFALREEVRKAAYARS